jgi:hypothetical protein
MAIDPNKLPKEVTLYGFGNCGWRDAIEDLQKRGKTVYTVMKPNPDQGFEMENSLDNLDCILPDPNIGMNSQAYLVESLVENLRRKGNGKGIIPILFIIDSEEFPIDPRSLAAKALVQKRFGFEHKVHSFTNFEARTAHYLSEHESVNPRLREMAKASLIYIKTAKNRDGTLSYTQVPAPDLKAILSAEKVAERPFVRASNDATRLIASKL